MATGEGNLIDSEFDYKTVEINEESLYTAGLIPGIASTAQNLPYINNTNFAVTAYNPDTPQPSGAYWEPAAEIKWYKNANNVLYKQKEELQLEVNVYKKIIKKLLKKQ
jgi:hypothetical protein